METTTYGVFALPGAAIAILAIAGVAALLAAGILYYFQPMNTPLLGLIVHGVAVLIALVLLITLWTSIDFSYADGMAITVCLSLIGSVISMAALVSSYQKSSLYSARPSEVQRGGIFGSHLGSTL